MNREQALAKARDAASRAAVLAGHAESTAHSDDPNRRHKVAQFAAAGAVWADVSRSYAALAAATPELQPEPETATGDDTQED